MPIVTPFEFISVALSFVLGLGLTRLLLAAVCSVPDGGISSIGAR